MVYVYLLMVFVFYIVALALKYIGKFFGYIWHMIAEELQLYDITRTQSTNDFSIRQAERKWSREWHTREDKKPHNPTDDLKIPEPVDIPEWHEPEPPTMENENGKQGTPLG